MTKDKNIAVQTWNEVIVSDDLNKSYLINSYGKKVFHFTFVCST